MICPQCKIEMESIEDEIVGEIVDGAVIDAVWVCPECEWIEQDYTWLSDLE